MTAKFFLPLLPGRDIKTEALVLFAERFRENHADRLGADYIELARMMAPNFAPYGIPIATRRVAAIHEAGHAVVVVALGWSVTRCFIEKKEMEWSGWCDWVTRDKRKAGLAALIYHQTVIAAGYTAEELYCPEWDAHSSSFDERVDLLYSLGKLMPVAIPMVTNLTRALLLTMQPAVERLADALERQGRLEGDAVAEIIGKLPAGLADKAAARIKEIVNTDDSGFIRQLLIQTGFPGDVDALVRDRQRSRRQFERLSQATLKRQLRADRRKSAKPGAVLTHEGRRQVMRGGLEFGAVLMASPAISTQSAPVNSTQIEKAIEHGHRTA